jgi:hypothetical protein
MVMEGQNQQRKKKQNEPQHLSKPVQVKQNGKQPNTFNSYCK